MSAKPVTGRRGTASYTLDRIINELLREVERLLREIRFVRDAGGGSETA